MSRLAQCIASFSFRLMPVYKCILRLESDVIDPYVREIPSIEQLNVQQSINAYIVCTDGIYDSERLYMRYILLVDHTLLGV